MLTPSTSLTRRTLIQVALRITVVVAIATVVSYWHIRSSLQQQALNHLEKFVEQRRARENHIFIAARRNLERLATAYAKRLKAVDVPTALERSAAYLAPRPDGTTRLHPDLFEQAGMTGFVGKYVDLTDTLRVRLMTAYDLITSFGPAGEQQFVNLYVVSPEPAIFMYWPAEPWALNASDWEVHGKLSLIGEATGQIVVTGQNAEPVSRQWSELYFDYGSQQWLISAIQSVSMDGQFHFIAGHDILLNELIDRTLTSGLEGTENFIIDHDGRLIAHPRFMEAILAKGGALPISEINDEYLQRILHIIHRHDAEPIIVPNWSDREFLAITRLEGPGWYLVTAMPEAIVAHQAITAARWILLFGGVALILEIGILSGALRKQVAQPLRRPDRGDRTTAERGMAVGSRCRSS